MNNLPLWVELMKKVDHMIIQQMTSDEPDEDKAWRIEFLMDIKKELQEIFNEKYENRQK